MSLGVRLVILGKQGAGKGTQCVQLSRHYVVPHISTGDMFRAAVKAGTPMGRMAKGFLDEGQLVPDEVVIGMVAERLSERDVKARGFILDGFPRTTHQARALAKLLSPFTLDLTVNLDVPTELVLRRLASRRVCKVCGNNYSVQQPPKFDWVCDHCGGEVIQREDDTEDAIRTRLELYEMNTSPLIKFYEQHGQLVNINGTLSPDDVFSSIVQAIDARRGAG